MIFIIVLALSVWDLGVELSSQNERSSPVKDGYGLRDAFPLVCARTVVDEISRSRLILSDKEDTRVKAVAVMMDVGHGLRCVLESMKVDGSGVNPVKRR